MDTKNVIAAISLSAAVIILYSLFFAPSPNELKKIQWPARRSRSGGILVFLILMEMYARYGTQLRINRPDT